MKVTCKFSAWMLSALLAGSMFTGCTSDSLGLPSGEGNMKLGPVKAADIVAYSGTTVHGSTFAGGTRSASEDSGWAETWDPDTWDGTKWHEILNAPKLNAATWDPEEWECIPNVALSEADIAEIRRLLRKGVPSQDSYIYIWVCEEYGDSLGRVLYNEHKDSLLDLIPDFPYNDCWVQHVYKGENIYEFEQISLNSTPSLSKPDPVKGSDYMVLYAYCHEPKDLLPYRYGEASSYVPYLDWSFGPSLMQRIDFKDSYSQEVCSCGETHEGTVLVEGLNRGLLDRDKDCYFPNDVLCYLDTHSKYRDVDNNSYWSKIITYKGEYYVGFDYEGYEFSPSRSDREWSPEWVNHYDYSFDDWIIKLTPARRKSNHAAEDHDSEVEVNLSVNEAQKSGYPASHMSLHVRTATNVETFIPVSAEHYAGESLTDILMMHDKNHLVSGETQTTEYTIGGNTVTLNIEYQAGGIRIWTEGINEEVIAYCRERFNDGITFEVWNYYNEGADTETLKPMLDGTTVKFTDKLPNYYINAFGKAGDELDCTVGIADEQRGDYGDGEEGAHLNGSDKNLIYTKR